MKLKNNFGHASGDGCSSGLKMSMTWFQKPKYTFLMHEYYSFIRNTYKERENNYTVAKDIRAILQMSKYSYDISA